MLYLDVAMPTALFTVVMVAMFLNKRVAGRLQSTVEEKELQTRDVILLVAFMAIIISAIAYTSIINPGAAFQNVLLLFFLSSYTVLLFTFSYVFSDLPKVKAQLLSVGFGVTGLVAGSACLLAPLQDSFTVYRVASFFGFAIFCFGVAVYERTKTSSKAQWYVAVQPAALFVLLFVFFNFIHNPGTLAVWSPFLMDVFGLTFAVLIIVYLSSLFSWKTVGLFAVLLTTMDIILVFSGPMVAAANTFVGLGLPVLVILPNIPLIFSSTGAILSNGLGLGDFFFAGVLAIQTFNKFGKKTAVISVIFIAVVFGIWEAYLPDILAWLSPILGHKLTGFPATLIILSGWVPVIAVKLLFERRKHALVQPVAKQPSKDLVSSDNLVK
jgi:hypothetical protein